ncbi:unnamed protein product, partial [Sphenostylis stenocarpa]
MVDLTYVSLKSGEYSKKNYRNPNLINGYKIVYSRNKSNDKKVVARRGTTGKTFPLTAC